MPNNVCGINNAGAHTLKTGFHTIKNNQKTAC
jgi:hypothetical protein